MNPEFTHEEIIGRLQTSFVVPFFQPNGGMHASWERPVLTYRIDTEYDATQRAAARQAFELWDDLVAIDMDEVTAPSENIYFERNMSLGSLVRHIDPALWVGGALAGGLAGAGFVVAGGAPALFAGAAFWGAAELTAAILAAVAAAGSVDPIKSWKIWTDGAFSPIKTDDLDFNFDDQTRIDWASVHIGDLAGPSFNGVVVPYNSLVGVGEFGFETYVHEIGHALGLSHSGPYNGSAPPRDDPSVYAQDTNRFTIMSYYGETEDGSGTNWFGSRPSTPMLHDVLAIQDKYGADPTTRTGDTVYGFNSTAGRDVFDFAINTLPVLTIYDAGGIDTLDASGFDFDQTIDLRVNKVGQELSEEKFSSIGDLTDNVAIAYDVVVENAIGGSKDDTITGNDADNTLSGNDGVDTLIGGDGNDTLDGGGDDDIMEGGADDDTYHVDSYLDVVVEAADGGLDEIITDLTTFVLPEPRFGGAFVENLTYTGRDRFLGIGNTLINRITGDRNNDTLDGGAGPDTLVGRGGDDTYYVDDSRDRVIEAAGEGIDTVHATVTLTLAANTENLVLDGTAAINGRGNALDNTITGNAAGNTLTGAGGADTLIGGGGVDTLVGGRGNDTYYVDNIGDSVVEAAGEGTDTVHATVTLTLSANAENLVLDGTAGINGTGNAQANTITGNSAGNMLNGAGGADTLIGGRGNDTYYVDNSGDSVIELAGEGIDSVRATVTATLSANTENLFLDGTAAINGTGNAQGNTITGNAAGNTLDGAGGVDTLIGGGGNDTYVTDGGDTIVEQLNQGTDLVRSSVSHKLGANVENLTLTGTAGIAGLGNDLNNILIGNFGANDLSGGAGNDRLTGGGGTDTFHFDAALDPVRNVDQIVDFNVVDDVMALHRSVFGTLATGVLSPDAFFRGQAAQDASDRIIYNPVNGNLIYDSNGSAAGGAMLFATLAPNLQLTSSDFLVM